MITRGFGANTILTRGLGSTLGAIVKSLVIRARSAIYRTYERVSQV